MKSTLELTSEQRHDIVKFRIENAQRTLSEVETLIQLGYYNTAANRLYYACYYAACALLIANKINTKTHDGVRQMLNLHFIKSGVFPTYYGRYYNELFNARTTGDYEDLFLHSEETISRLLPKAQEFVDALKQKVDEWLAAN